MPKEKINLIHIACGMGGGRGAMVRELHYAIEKYHSEKFNQRIYINNPKKDGIVNEIKTPYKLKFEYKSSKNIYKEVINLPNLIIIDHKTSSSDTKYFKRFKNKKIPIICVCHTYSSSSINSTITRCNHVIPVAKSLMDYLPSRNKWMNSSNTTIINNSVNEDIYKTISPMKRENKDVFFTGRINAGTSRKHGKDWIPFWRNVNLNKKMVHEYMGKVSGKQTLLNGKNDIKFWGHISDFNKKVSILKSWDCLLYGIKGKEGVSMAIMEALACGIPCIISNSPGNIEVIKNGINGYVFKDLKHAKKIINNNILANEGQMKELKRNTKQYFHDYLRSEIWVNKYIKIIERYIK